jgi:hypothetical protein
MVIVLFATLKGIYKLYYPCIVQSIYFVIYIWPNLHEESIDYK